MKTYAVVSKVTNPTRPEDWYKPHLMTQEPTKVLYLGVDEGDSATLEDLKPQKVVLGFWRGARNHVWRETPPG